jgi:hypothetical protein
MYLMSVPFFHVKAIACITAFKTSLLFDWLLSFGVAVCGGIGGEGLTNRY